MVEDDQGRIVTAAIATYGDTIHSLVQRDGYAGTFMPQFRPTTWSRGGASASR